MKKIKIESEQQMIVLTALVCAAILVYGTGCTVKTEFGWHGKTGRDDRTQTELVGSEKWDAEREYYNGRR